MTSVWAVSTSVLDVGRCNGWRVTYDDYGLKVAESLYASEEAATEAARKMVASLLLPHCPSPPEVRRWEWGGGVGGHFAEVVEREVNG